MAIRRAHRPRGTAPKDPARSQRARESQQRGKAEQAKGVALLLWLQFFVYEVGTTRRKQDYQGTMQTPGISDVLFFTKPTEGRPKRLVWWESKAGSGKMSPAQREFRQHTLEAGVTHIVGDVSALMDWLVLEHYLRRDQVAHYYHAADR